MRVCVRVDSGKHIGLGHLVRCLRLGQELARRGAKVTFVTRTHTNHAVGLLEHHGFDVLPMKPRHEHNRDVSSWLGAPPDLDAAETIRALDATGGADWVVVDHYAIDAAWHRHVGTHARNLLVIDDLKNRQLDADIVLNQNLGATERDYAGLVPPATRLLVGPHNALLASEYRTARAQRAKTPAPMERANLLISLGGSDPANTTGRVLEELEHALDRFTRVDVVISHHHPNREAFHARWAPYRNVFVYVQPPSLVDLLLTTDIAIGAGGSSTWERLCIGVPAVTLVLADNQRDAARALAEQDLAVVSHTPWASEGGVRTLTLGLLEDAPRRLRMADAGRQLVDADGTRRVADTMEGLHR